MHNLHVQVIIRQVRALFDWVWFLNKITILISVLKIQNYNRNWILISVSILKSQLDFYNSITKSNKINEEKIDTLQLERV